MGCCGLVLPQHAGSALQEPPHCHLSVPACEEVMNRVCPMGHVLLSLSLGHFTAHQPGFALLDPGCCRRSLAPSRCREWETEP